MKCEMSWIVEGTQLTQRKGFGIRSSAANLGAHSAGLAVKSNNNARQLISKITKRASTDQWLSRVLTISKRSDIQ